MRQVGEEEGKKKGRWRSDGGGSDENERCRSSSLFVLAHASRLQTFARRKAVGDSALTRRPPSHPFALAALVLRSATPSRTDTAPHRSLRCIAVQHRVPSELTPFASSTFSLFLSFALLITMSAHGHPDPVQYAADKFMAESQHLWSVDELLDSTDSMGQRRIEHLRRLGDCVARRLLSCPEAMDGGALKNGFSSCVLWLNHNHKSRSNDAATAKLGVVALGNRATTQREVFNGHEDRLHFAVWVSCPSSLT